MRWSCVALCALAMSLAPSRPALGDDEDYVKIEIKGTFDMAQPGMGPSPGGPVSVCAGRGQYFALDLSNMPGGPPAEKQLKEFVGKKVVVTGKPELPCKGVPRIQVTQIVLFKDPGPIMN